MAIILLAYRGGPNQQAQLRRQIGVFWRKVKHKYRLTAQKTKPAQEKCE